MVVVESSSNLAQGALREYIVSRRCGEDLTQRVSDL